MNGEGTTAAAMGTLVTIHAVRPGADEAIGRSVAWLYEIEVCCTRFNGESELTK